jgi:hypothetical protein
MRQTKNRSGVPRQLSRQIEPREATMPKHTVEILEWLPFERNTLLGFAKIRIKELRLVISGVAIHQTCGK